MTGMGQPLLTLPRCRKQQTLMGGRAGSQSGEAELSGLMFLLLFGAGSL